MLELNSRHVGKVTTPTSARNMDSVVVANLVLDTTCGQELHHAAGLLWGMPPARVNTHALPFTNMMGDSRGSGEGSLATLKTFRALKMFGLSQHFCVGGTGIP